MSRNSLAVAIEALSWAAYAGTGERAALFKSAEQLGVNRSDELQQAHKLVMETTRFQNRLERLISNAVDANELKRAPHGVSSFLRILAFLTYIDDAPVSTLKQNVKWARQTLGWQELHPFEKAIAHIASGTSNVHSNNLNEFQRVALEVCHPTWFVERTVLTFGRVFALKMMRRNLNLLPTYIRLNSLNVRDPKSPEDIARQIGGSRVEHLQGVFKIDRGRGALTRSSLFHSGQIVLQDLASIVAGFVASPERDTTVLDLCAAPGNKTSHLAAIMQNQGDIYSIDISELRLEHWKTEMKRTGVNVAIPVRADLRNIPLKIEADVVLLDPPCSNTGVFSRNPSIKWRATRTRVGEFSSRQYWMLRAAAEHVAPQGTLIYCTCSVLPEENELVIESFLREEHNFKLVPQTPFIGSPGLRGMVQCQRFYPHLHDCNGYFIAKLQRSD